MPKVVATIPVRDEDWILEKVLTDVSTYVDEIVIVDDGSVDKTPEIIRSFAKVTSIHTNPRSTLPFCNGRESDNRNKLLSLARKRKAEVVLQLDSDEMFESRIKEDLPKLLNMKKSVKFQLCHLWKSVDHFRVDGEWGNFFRYRLYWMNRRLRFSPQPLIATPRAYDRKNRTKSGLKIVHFGWLQAEKHLRRYYEVYKIKHPEMSVSFEEFKNNEEMQSDLRIIRQNDDQTILKTWVEVMGEESQEKYRL